MSLRTFTCPHCGANLMIEIGRKKTVCEYCDSELYLDEIISDIKRDRNRDDREDEKRSSARGAAHVGGYQQSGSHGGYESGSQGGYESSTQGGSQGSAYNGGYSGNTYENRTQSQSYASGYNAPGTSMPRVSPKSRMVVLLLCVFLGIFGVHRFYVGKIGTGLVYFFTFAVFGFGWIFDMILIVTGFFRDSRGLPIIDWGM